MNPLPGSSTHTLSLASLTTVINTKERGKMKRILYQRGILGLAEKKLLGKRNSPLLSFADFIHKKSIDKKLASCYTIVNDRQMGVKMAIKEKKECPVCLTKFEAKNYWQKYCSARCKLAMWAVKVFKKETLERMFKEKNDELEK